MDTKQTINNGINKTTKHLTSKNAKEIGWRALSLFFSSIFISALPVLLFAIYMHENSFFSYDFFTEGAFGLKTFFALLAIMIIISSTGLYSFIIPIIEKTFTKKITWWNLIPLSSISALVWSIVLVIIFSSEDLNVERVAYVALICLLTMTHIGMLIYADPKKQFISLILFASLVFASSFHLREGAASLVGSALKGFGSGGNSCVLVTDTEAHYSMVGELLLAAPKYIYLREQEKNGVTVIKVDSDTIYRVEPKKECTEKETGQSPGT